MSKEKKLQMKPFELNEFYLLRARAHEALGEHKKAIKFLTKKSIA